MESTFRLLKNPLTENYLNLKKEIFGKNISWIYHENSVTTKLGFKENCPYYGHNVLERPEYTDVKSEDIDSRVRSGGYPMFRKVLDEIFEFNNIQVKTYYRISVNSCFHLPNLKELTQAPIHVDHEYEHRQMIIYFNNSSASTNIYDKRFSSHEDENKSNLCLKIYPNEDQIITFDGLHFHSYEYPPSHEERRVVLVCTYC